MRLTSIETARGVAACLVVAFHATAIVAKYFHSAPLGNRFSFGYAGVDFFFVLSGFIIYTVYAKDADQPEKLKPFLYKRLIRIFPVYWAILAAIIPAYFLTRHWDGIQVVKSAMLWPQTDSANILPPAWTISYELLFYAIFSLAIINKRLGIAVFTLWQFSVLVAVMFGNNSSFLLNIRNLEFLFGIAVAILPRLNGKWSVFAGAGVFLALGAVETSGGGAVSPIAYGLSSSLIVYGLACLEKSPVTLPQGFTLLGAASYSIYLIHVPTLSALAKILVHLPLSPNAAFITLTTLSVLGGIAFHLLAEKKILAFFNPKLPYILDRVRVGGPINRPATQIAKLPLNVA